MKLSPLLDRLQAVLPEYRNQNDLYADICQVVSIVREVLTILDTEMPPPKVLPPEEVAKREAAIDASWESLQIDYSSDCDNCGTSNAYSDTNRDIVAGMVSYIRRCVSCGRQEYLPYGVFGPISWKPMPT